jgi:hypothetical protein
MNTVQLMAEYARLADCHNALATLVSLKVITADEQIRLTRKFMDDRPDFKQHVAEAMGGKVVPPGRGTRAP